MCKVNSLQTMKAAWFWLTQKTFSWYFLFWESICITTSTFSNLFQLLSSVSTITRLFLLDIGTILNTCLVFSIQHLLPRKHKKASHSSPTLERLGVKVMGRGILAVGLHVDFQSLQRWVYGQMPEDSCCLKYERANSRQLPASSCACWWQVQISDRWKTSNVPSLIKFGDPHTKQHYLEKIFFS